MGLFDFFKRRKHEQTEGSAPSAIEGQTPSGVCDVPLEAKYTPEIIMTLGRRDIFVFGSNLTGHHAEGAARIALNRFGAIWGQGECLQGNSYAIPIMQGRIESIKPYVDRFIKFAEYEKDLTFYVTKIECEIGGFEIKDIAPLFCNACNLPNVIFPIEFLNYKGNTPTDGNGHKDVIEDCACCEVTNHCYGITRTFADIILGLNEEKKYTSPNEALSDLDAYLLKFRDNNAAALAVRTIRYILIGTPELFANGHLDVSLLRIQAFEKNNFLTSCNKAYDSYCREKLINLISYLNEFRRYSSFEELWNDILRNLDNSSIIRRTACAPTPDFYYLALSGHKSIYYPVTHFMSAIQNLWSEITTNGILDAQKMIKEMFGNHDESVKQFGLDATIQKDYIEDSPCHPEVFVPKVLGTAPIYVKDDKTGRYIRSCGEGKGPNSIPDWLEFQIAKQILAKDKSYKHVRNYYIPKYDNTLPFYSEYDGRLVFKTQEEKLKFIEDIKRGKQ